MRDDTEEVEILAISEEEIAVAIDLAEEAYSYVEPFYREKWGMDERLAATQITKAKLSPEVRDKFWRSS